MNLAKGQLFGKFLVHQKNLGQNTWAVSAKTPNLHVYLPKQHFCLYKKKKKRRRRRKRKKKKQLVQMAKCCFPVIYLKHSSDSCKFWKDTDPGLATFREEKGSSLKAVNFL